MVGILAQEDIPLYTIDEESLLDCPIGILSLHYMIIAATRSPMPFVLISEVQHYLYAHYILVSFQQKKIVLFIIKQLFNVNTYIFQRFHIRK